MTNTPTPGKRALISGASIAGPALAHWLNAYGWATTVIERAPDLRDAGQNIDIRGAARTVIRRMHMEEQILASGTGEQGTQFVDADGAVKAAFPAGDSDTDGATAEMEILRGQLARLLHERSKPGTEYVFGDHITSIDQSSHGPATVSFAQSQDRQFDVVVIAEGMNSATRGQVFPGEAVIRPLGMYTAYLSIPRTDQDNRWWRWYSATHGRAITLRPDNVGRTRATLSFLSDPRGYENLDPAAQRTVLRTTFADAGWQAHRVLAALTDSEDMYFEQIGQVRAPRWSNGAVVLLGDAAYCASPISGMGTSLALSAPTSSPVN